MSFTYSHPFIISAPHLLTNTHILSHMHLWILCFLWELCSMHRWTRGKGYDEGRKQCLMFLAIASCPGHMLGNCCPYISKNYKKKKTKTKHKTSPSPRDPVFWLCNKTSLCFAFTKEWLPMYGNLGNTSCLVKDLSTRPADWERRETSS